MARLCVVIILAAAVVAVNSKYIGVTPFGYATTAHSFALPFIGGFRYGFPVAATPLGFPVAKVIPSPIAPALPAPYAPGFPVAKAPLPLAPGAYPSPYGPGAVFPLPGGPFATPYGGYPFPGYNPYYSSPSPYGPGFPGGPLAPFPGGPFGPSPAAALPPGFPPALPARITQAAIK